MLYINDITVDNGAFELSASTHHWVKRNFPLPRPSYDDFEYFKKTRKLPKPIIENLKPIEGLEMSSISADLYGDGRDDLALFYFSKGANYATLTTSNSITSEFIPWNNNSHKKIRIQKKTGSSNSKIK